MRTAKILLTIPLAATIIVALTRATVHFELSWPMHAQHHLVHQIVLFIGISILGLLLVFGPLKRKESWAWWALLVTGLSIFGGFWLGHPLVGLGEPGMIPNTAQGILTLCFALGLGFAWFTLNKQEDHGLKTDNSF